MKRKEKRERKIRFDAPSWVVFISVFISLEETYTRKSSTTTSTALTTALTTATAVMLRVDWQPSSCSHRDLLPGDMFFYLATWRSLAVENYEKVRLLKTLQSFGCRRRLFTLNMSRTPINGVYKESIKSI